MSENNNDNEMGPRQRRYREQQQRNPHLKPHKKRPWLITLLIVVVLPLLRRASHSRFYCWELILVH